MPITVEVPKTDGPAWLGGLRLETNADGDLVLTALSSRGHDKYEWTIPADNVSKTLGLIGVRET